MLKKVLAATAGLGALVGLPSAAHAFVPAVIAAWAVGAGLGGLFLGSAISNNPPVVATAAPVAVAPAVTVNQTTCYFTHRWVDRVWTRVQVCTTPAP